MDFKDYFNEQSVGTLATAIECQHPPLDRETFLAQVFDDGWTARELKERMRHITTVLHAFMPADYADALDVLRRALPVAGGVVYHRKANGRLAPKVFKLAKKTIRPGEVLHVEKKHSFAPVTIRTYYPGEHAIEPKINGRLFGRATFTILSEAGRLSGG
jgi:hypothetical protein